MAWFRMMGVDSVDYHRATVLGRGDDHSGQALGYYGSRGETPLQWGGRLAERLGLVGPVDDAGYDAIFGPGGGRDPHLGMRLVRTRRPGVEVVVAAHKSVAVLGLIGRADDMHAILDAETDATLAFLQGWFARQGGRRGRSQRRTPTGGLLWAPHGTPLLEPVTRHHTITCSSPTSPRCWMTGEAGRHWTPAPYATCCTRPPWSAASPPPRPPSSWAMPSSPTTDHRANSITGPLPASRPRSSTCLQAGGRHRRRPGGRRLRLLPGSWHRRPRHPRPEVRRVPGVATGPLARRAGRDRLACPQGQPTAHPHPGPRPASAPSPHNW